MGAWEPSLGSWQRTGASTLPTTGPEALWGCLILATGTCTIKLTPSQLSGRAWAEASQGHGVSRSWAQKASPQL